MLKDAGKNVVEDGGVMSNPTADKLREGARIAREADADLLLAVGGGSVIDYARGVSVSAHCHEDPWDKYYFRMERPDNEIIPMGSILTMSGTGSEMNGGSVITNPEVGLKIGLEPDQYDDVVKATFLLDGGYKKLSPEDVREILVESE